MKCIKSDCDGVSTKVIRTTKVGEITYRRHECTKCGSKFNTNESRSSDPIPEKRSSVHRPLKVKALAKDDITARDYFAAKAMQSAYIHYSGDDEATKHWTSAGLAESAYAMADAMLEARK